MGATIKLAAQEVVDEWDRYIGTDEAEGHDDAVLVGEAIGRLREALTNESSKDGGKP